MVVKRSADVMGGDKYDLFSDAFRRDPYSVYARARREDPLWWSAHSRAWHVFRYEDAITLLKHPDFSSNRITYTIEQFPPEAQSMLCPAHSFFGKWVVFMDPPEHTPIRGLLNRSFTPQLVRSYESQIVELAQKLLARATQGDQWDLIADFAVPLPTQVIAIVMGLEPRDFPFFKQHADVAMQFLGGTTREISQIEAMNHSLEALHHYFDPIIEERRRKAGRDLISQMVIAQDEGAALSNTEIFANAMLVLVAGHETTVNLIGNGAWLMLSQPNVHKAIAQSPDAWEGVVEEVLRMEAPVQRFARHVVRDYALHDQVMRRGDTVIIHLASANRDAEEFPEPDRFDPLREHLNRHLSFGWGTHYCLGAPLARLEGCLALQALWEKCFPDWQVSPDWVPEWNENLGFRGLKRLPLVKKC